MFGCNRFHKFVLEEGEKLPEDCFSEKSLSNKSETTQGLIKYSLVCKKWLLFDHAAFFNSLKLQLA